MSKGDTFENDILKLIFNGTPIAGLADNAASSPLANLYLALHSADPGEGGSQTTSEAGYTSYARAAVPRTTAGFTVVANAVNLAAAVPFPKGTGGSGSLGYWSVGTAPSGAGKVLYSGALDKTITAGDGVQPILGTGTTITED